MSTIMKGAQVAALVPRFACRQLKVLSDGLRVVMVNGPRQAGKSTLLRQFHELYGGSIRSLDLEADLEAALGDPAAFVTVGAMPRIIDEIQRGGDRLILAIKVVVDQDNARGQFVLSGSTRFLTVPNLSESLAGRVAIMELWPFTVAERAGVDGSVGQVLIDSPRDLLGASPSPWTRADYLELIHTGGFPEAVAMPPGRSRHGWYETYLDTVIQRDIGQFADLHHAAVLPRLLHLLATRSGTPIVASDLASTVGVSQPTIRNYLFYLDTVFLTLSLPAWHPGITTKAARNPRTYLVDSGLAADLLGVGVDAIRQPGHAALGPLVETFAVTELTKLFAYGDRRVDVRYFRDRDGREVDLVLESRDGRVTALEIKASSSPTTRDFRHLSWLRDKLGDRFTGGIVFHLGPRTNSFGDRLIAAPLSALWHHATL